MSNLPPGCTPQDVDDSAGPQERYSDTRWCNHCEAETEQSLFADRWDTWWSCWECDRSEDVVEDYSP